MTATHTFISHSKGISAFADMREVPTRHGSLPQKIGSYELETGNGSTYYLDVGGDQLLLPIPGWDDVLEITWYNGDVELCQIPSTTN